MRWSVSTTAVNFIDFQHDGIRRGKGRNEISTRHGPEGSNQAVICPKRQRNMGEKRTATRQAGRGAGQKRGVASTRLWEYRSMWGRRMRPLSDDSGPILHGRRGAGVLRQGLRKLVRGDCPVITQGHQRALSRQSVRCCLTGHVLSSILNSGKRHASFKCISVGIAMVLDPAYCACSTFP